MPVSFAMHVRISECNSEAPTGLIVLKFFFFVGDFHENLWRNSTFDENSTRPKYVYIFDSCMKYFVARGQCKGNPLFHVREKKINNFILLTAECRSGTHCCVLVAMKITRTRQNFTLNVLYFSCSWIMMVY